MRPHTIKWLIQRHFPLVKQDITSFLCHSIFQLTTFSLVFILINKCLNFLLITWNFLRKPMFLFYLVLPLTYRWKLYLLYYFPWVQFSSVHFSRSVMSDSLWPYKSQHARPPCPSPTPRVHTNPCPSSRWCHPAISSSVVPFSSCPQSLPASEPFPMSQLFVWGGQTIGVSALALGLSMNTQDWSPLEWTGWIFLQSKGLTSVFSNTTVQKH